MGEASVDATAAAVSALVMAEQYGDSTLNAQQPDLLDTAYQGDLSELVLASITWLSEHQNPDGGFGAGSGQPSELTTSLMVLSAFRLTCVPARFADLEPRLDAYLRSQGGAGTLRKTLTDRAKLTGVLTHAALAGVIPWKQSPVTRFERVAAPDWLRRVLGRPQFDQNDPVLLSAGLARFHQSPPSNRMLRWARRVSVPRCVELIEQRQSPDGGFGNSTRLSDTLATSFVAMSLASAGRASQKVVRRAIEALLSRVGSDANWQ